MTWQPIDTAPKDGTRVLLFVPALPRQPIHIGHFSHFEHGALRHEWKCWVIEGGPYSTESPEPSHWMPLPLAPATTEAAS